MKKTILVLGIGLFVITSSVFAANAHNRADVESKVRELFADAPVMIDVARCESTFRQFADSGNPFRGGTNRKYIGVFQISEDLHRAPALALGFDIDTIEGNVGYARHMYDRQGTRPWVSCLPASSTGSSGNGSSTTLGTPSGTTSTNSGSFPITRNLETGMVHDQVLALQKMLNEYGFTIASSGPGSPGNETNMYGALTRRAVEKFQCAKNIVCPDGSYLIGYGYVGPKTRATLEKMAQE